jgi:hypothetical protein
MLVLDSLPQGARVIIDGEGTGKKTPLTIDNLESGIEHEVKLELEGEQPVTGTVAITAGQKLNKTMIFADAVVELTVVSHPMGAEVWMDKRSIGFTPDAVAKVKAGQEINLRVTKTGYIDFVKAIVPERKKPITLDVVLEKTEALINQEAVIEAAEKAAAEESSETTTEDLDADDKKPSDKPAKRKRKPR